MDNKGNKNRYIFAETTKKMRFKNRIWLETDSGILLGRGRLKLLLAIKEFGSITKAAKSIGMSYKKAWKLIDQLNVNAPKAVVERSTGGKGGGGTYITNFGLTLVDHFEEVNQKCDEFLLEQSQIFNNDIMNEI